MGWWGSKIHHFTHPHEKEKDLKVTDCIGHMSDTQKMFHKLKEIAT